MSLWVLLMLLLHIIVLVGSIVISSVEL